MIIKHLLTASIALIISGCVGSTPKGNIHDEKPKPTPSEGCLVSNPSDVKLSLVAMPGSSNNSRKSLRADFVVTAPTPGYKFALRANQAMSSQEKVVVDLLVTRPAGMVIQVITQSKVGVMLDGYSGSEGSSVQVNCGGKAFFKVDKVMSGS